MRQSEEAAYRSQRLPRALYCFAYHLEMRRGETASARRVGLLSQTFPSEQLETIQCPQRRFAKANPP